MTPYDRVARFYDVDMARNMGFDDVAFYARACEGRDPVLELGCGNGRILLPLAAAGHEAWGVDASAGMLAGLAAKAAGVGVPPRTVQADIRSFVLPRRFGAILCPYSLVTYLVGDDDASAMLASVLAHLAPGGRLVIDAFVPRAIPPAAAFRLDYRRPWGEGTLARWKRIAAIDATTNRIDRRYQLLDATGRPVETIAVSEVIRPRAPAELRQLVESAGFEVEGAWWDYGARPGPDGAQFYTLAARAAG
jgi:SAM-dependent methyltransferase